MKKEKLKTITWEIAKLAITALIGASFAYYTFYKQYNAEQDARMNDNLNKILDVNMQYPFVSNDSFIEKWNLNKQSNSDSSLRYDTYCEYVFDCLDNVCDNFDYDSSRVNNFVDAKDLIYQQKGWWDEPENEKSYSPEFISFVNNIYYKK